MIFFAILEKTRTEADDRDEARTVTTVWHPVLRLPKEINEPLKKTAYDYYDNGDLKSLTVYADGNKREWTFTYKAPSQIGRIDGPRTDVNDVTVFDYDAQGNLFQIKNALGHITRLSDYDAHGRPQTISDPNGLITTCKYDLRGRLHMSKEGEKQTVYEYDDAGQLTKIIQPDGSFIGYKYDQSHRLKEIQDNLDNKIVYELDDMGNRFKKDVYDPDGKLTATRIYDYDALNRLEKVRKGDFGVVDGMLENFWRRYKNDYLYI